MLFRSNYIPTMGPDSIISLPPPHELSQPVAPEAPPPPPAEASRPSSSRPRAGSRAAETASIAHSVRSGAHEGRKYATMPSRMSVRSPGSTHLSELDLLSPPREGEIDYRGKGKVREAVSSPLLGVSDASRSTPGQSPTQRIAEEWRNANQRYLRSPSPVSVQFGANIREIN